MRVTRISSNGTSSTPCDSCGKYFRLSGQKDTQQFCVICRIAASNAKKINPPKMNFTSNVPQGTEVASVFPYKSSSSPGTVYECRLYTDGSTSCQCPGWTRRIGAGGLRECKHTKDVDKKKASILAALNGQPLPEASAPSNGRSTSAHKAPPAVSGRKFDLDA